jgi:acetyltransferase-like isoleucine patch superfamily enzyme
MTFLMPFDDSCMGEKVKAQLKKCGEGVTIYPLAKIVNAQMMEIGDHSVINDFSFIYAGQGITIGRYCRVACFASIIGGGILIMGDYAVVSYGARMVTGTDTYQSGKRMGPLPLEYRDVQRGSIIIEKDGFVGTNVVVHPNVKIGEGAIIGSNSLVTHDIEPWSINIGSPCRKIGERPRIVVEDI